ncbi:hypothetical protein EVJ50_06750 [Synechococcus sp. RSCCF101]|nr:hypothetical protein EVJ50_06750 [Synechococcus sp. RSCCF101]
MRTKPPTVEPRWLPSREASQALGISRSTLRAMALAGFLEEGRHFRRGWRPSASWSWEVNGVHRAILARNAPHLAMQGVAE